LRMQSFALSKMERKKLGIGPTMEGSKPTP